MAIRLAMAFGTSAESWLHQESMFDHWQAEQRRPRPDVQRLTFLSGQPGSEAAPAP